MDSLFVDNEIGIYGAIAITDALKVNTTLTSLDLHCNFYFIYFIYFWLFIDNRIGVDGATVIARSLKVNTTLRELFIGG